MTPKFNYPQKDLDAYCPCCNAVFKHQLNSQLRMQTHQASLLHCPLEMRCSQCHNSQIYFARELADFSPVGQGQWHKIAGKNRLVVRDQVYVPGTDFPGQVKTRLRSDKQEIFILTHDDKSESQWTPNPSDSQINLPLSPYRLLPLAAEDTRIGDPVWHAGREQAGLCMGIIFGNPSRLVVLLDDGNLITLTIPNSKSVVDPIDLHKATLDLIRAYFPPAAGDLQIDSRSGILFVTGHSDSLQRWIELRRKLQAIPHCRGIVEQIRIEPSEIVPDDIIENNCRNLMLAPHFSIFNFRVHCSAGHCRVDAYCRSETQRAEAIEALETVHGLCSVEAEIIIKPEDSPSDRDLSMHVAQALRSIRPLNSCVIRIHCINGETFLEGVVASRMQLNLAGVSTRISGRKFRINNLLRIDSKYPFSESNIRVV